MSCICSFLWTTFGFDWLHWLRERLVASTQPQLHFTRARCSVCCDTPRLSQPILWVMLASLLLAHTTSAVTKLYLPKRVQIKPRCDWNEGFNLQGCSATTLFWNIHTHMHTFRGNKISKVIFIQIFNISNSDTGVLKDLLKWFYSISTVSERSVHLFSPFSRPSVEPRKFSFFCSGFYLKTNV